MTALNQFAGILLLGVVAGIIYTLATHPDAIRAGANGIDTLYKTAVGATQGRVA